MDILAWVKLAHLTGLVMGLGGAILADYTTLTRGVVRPVSPFTVHQVEFLSRIVLVGLCLLWLSGIAIIWLNLQTKVDYLTNQKLWAKIIIVMVLTLNGGFVHGVVLPYLRKSVGRRLFEGVGATDRAVLTALGSISFVSWVMPFMLAKATHMNYVTPVQNILIIYAVSLLVVWAAAFGATSGIAKLQSFALRLAAMTLLPNEPWEDYAALPRMAPAVAGNGYGYGRKLNGATARPEHAPLAMAPRGARAARMI